MVQPMMHRKLHNALMHMYQTQSAVYCLNWLALGTGIPTIDLEVERWTVNVGRLGNMSK